jgi:hypothetical protein
MPVYTVIIAMAHTSSDELDPRLSGLRFVQIQLLDSHERMRLV